MRWGYISQLPGAGPLSRTLCTATRFGHTALDMRKVFIYALSAVGALGLYALGNAAGLSNILVLVLSFIGALAGSFAGTYVTQRRS